MQYKVGRTLAKSNYTETDLANFRKTASMYGVNVVTFSDKQEFVEYINDKDGENSRAEDKIDTMVSFCHGQCPKYSGSEENQLSFVLSATNSEKMIHIILHKVISNCWIKKLLIILRPFFSCNAGTEDESGNSFAQTWSNKKAPNNNEKSDLQSDTAIA